MLDRNYVLENLEQVQQNIRDRGLKLDITTLPELSRERSSLVTQIDDLRRQANENAKEMKQKLADDERRERIDRGRELKGQIAALEGEVAAAQERENELLRQVPNMTHPDSPIGLTEDENREIERVGEPLCFTFDVLDHVELGKKLDLIDFEAGNKVAGANFYFLKNEAVLLEMALVRYTLDVLRSEGFVLHTTPDLARPAILDGIGFNPRGAETQIYSIAEQDLSLIATAEITLGGMLQGDIIETEKLPLLLAGVSHCFRTEAGAHGRASRGLYRVHQFTKVEMFAYTTPEQSAAIHDQMLAIEKRIFSDLEIPFRVVDICTGDLGAPAYRKYDIEAWMPGRGDNGEYGEVTSTSNCTDYQARRLNIRYRPEAGAKPRFVHTLNGTAVAISRALIAVLENHQTPDGGVTIPQALVPYMGMERIKPRV